jgi:hypothetical protein
VAGSTGLSTGVHLHFGVQSAQGAWINPLAFLKKVASYELVALKGSGSATKSGGGVLRGLASAGLAESRLGPPG